MNNLTYDKIVSFIWIIVDEIKVQLLIDPLKSIPRDFSLVNVMD